MKRLLLGYSVAMFVSGSTAVSLLGLREWITVSPFALFLAAVLISTWVGGVGPGVLATLVGALSGSYFFLDANNSFELTSPSSTFRLVAFTLVAILIIRLNSQLQVARRRAELARADAESNAAELRTLDQISSVSLCAASVDKLLQGLLVAVRDALSADAVRVLLLDEGRNTLITRASNGASQRIGGSDYLPLGQGIVGRAAPGQSAVSAKQVQNGIADETEAWGEDIRSIAGVPLVMERRTIGVLDIGARTSRQLTSQDLRLLRLVADRVAIAIERARLLDAERQAYASARRAVAVRDEFLAHASHELRTPLSHIKGFVSTLRQTDIDWDEVSRADFLEEAEHEADRLAKMITDLLDMSRLESGGLEPGERARVTPLELVKGGRNRVRGLLGNHDVEINVPRDLPVLLVDVAQVERVIANLLENSAKYSQPDLPILVSAKRNNSHIEFRVDDEGPGVPDDSLERIFEKFVRLQSVTRTVSGTGLGLPISRYIAEAHGGSLRAEARTSGTRFVLVLPLTPGWEPQR